MPAEFIHYLTIRSDDRIGDCLKDRDNGRLYRESWVLIMSSTATNNVLIFGFKVGDPKSRVNSSNCPGRGIISAGLPRCKAGPR